MSERVVSTRHDDVAVLQIDNPPVNAISSRVSDQLAEALQGAERDPGVRAIVIMGAGKTFIAGADIRELERAAWGEDAALPDIHDLLAQMEECPKPVVIGLHGTALGGGLELAMAGHYRVAVADARMGQPEVNLGIIPGAEGTQRLPRLAGVEKAIEMCVSGRPIDARDAHAAGIVDRILDGELQDGAVAFAREVADTPTRKTSARTDKLGDRAALDAQLQAGRELARKTRRNMLAPQKVVDAIEAAATLSFADGCRRERELFAECVTSEQCKALVHAFFAERGVSKIPDVSKDTPARAIERVAIVGAGTMGSGIAMACANAGIPVLLRDTTQAALDASLARIRKNYERSVSRGRFSQAVAEQRIANIRSQTGADGFDTVDLIIEAAFENLALKKEIFAELDRIAGNDCILATNTSTLDVDAIASATGRPESVIGLHFFSPANVMRLLEIVRGTATSRTLIATALALAKRLRKVGVVVRNGPGFVGNRMMFPYMYEAQFLVEEGASPEQVDHALTHWGMAMGIFAVDDMGGLDVAWRVRQELRQFEGADRVPLVADKLVEMGRLGQKTGKGWYWYAGDRTPIPDPEVIELVEQVAESAGISRRTFTDEQIIERTIYALINEGAKVLDEGVALRAADIDTVYLTGYGFPAYRGGPMFCADRIGLSHVLERVRAFHREHGARWAPAPLLERLAASGRTFRALDAERAEASS